MSLNDELRALAARQYGLVARRQALALGATTSGLASRVHGPDWDAPTPRVLRLVGSTPGVRQQLMLAVLDTGPGSVVSHEPAAALWRLPGFSFAPVHVSRPRRRSNRRSVAAVVHHPRLLPASHMADRHGIPVTSLARTIFDLAGVVHAARIERIVDTVVTKSPSALTALHAMASDLRACGRSGTAAMGAVLAVRPPGYVPAASGLEARFARILVEAGEAPLDRQVDVGGHEWVGRVDFLDRGLRVVVEVDSHLHHSSLLDRAHDLRRDEQLRAAGWTEVVRVTEEEIWRQPRLAVARVRAARHRARSRLAALPALVSETHGYPWVSDTRASGGGRVAG